MPISKEEFSMFSRIIRTAFVLVGLTIASQALADQPQPNAAQSYWQNLKSQMMSPATSAPPIQQPRPAAVTSVRG
jgi:hypothetical protein